MFVQPCLIKKNTAKLRKQLETIGYKRAMLNSIEPNYNNDKEPWILCAYDIYVCLDKDYYEEMIDELASNSFLQMIPELSKTILDCKKDEKSFIENASKSVDINIPDID